MATIIVVLLATQTREVSTAPRICAVVGLALITALGFAAAHSFTSQDEDLHISAGPWLFALGAVLMAPCSCGRRSALGDAGAAGEAPTVTAR